MIGTKAIDQFCPTCKMPAGEACVAVLGGLFIGRLHRARVEKATEITRDANIAARSEVA